MTKILVQGSKDGAYGFPYRVKLQAHSDGRGRLIEEGFAWSGNTGGMRERRTWIPAQNLRDCAEFIQHKLDGDWKYWNPSAVLQDAAVIFGN